MSAEWHETAVDAGPAVDPLRSLTEVRAVRALLADRPRDLLLFSLGINNGLRAGDFLRVTVNQVRGLAPGQMALVREKRTGGRTALTVPACAAEALRRHLENLAPPDPPADMYLFAGQRGWSPLTTQRLDELVAEWARAAGLHGHYGAHTLRKTFGYLQRTLHGVDFAVLAHRFGHASGVVTMRYLGLTADVDEGVELQEI